MATMGYAEIAAEYEISRESARQLKYRKVLRAPDAPDSLPDRPRWLDTSVKADMAKRPGMGAPGRPGKRALRRKHKITVVGPLNLPGGRKGLFQAYCSCKHYISAPNVSEEAAQANGDAHVEDVTAHQKEKAREQG